MVSRPGLLLYRPSDKPFVVQIRYDTRGHGRTGGPDNPEGYISKRTSAHRPLGSMELERGLYSVR